MHFVMGMIWMRWKCSSIVYRERWLMGQQANATLYIVCLNIEKNFFIVIHNELFSKTESSIDVIIDFLQSAKSR